MKSIRFAIAEDKEAVRGNQIGGKKFTCEQCDYATNTKASLKKHTAAKHKHIPHPPSVQPQEVIACRRSVDGCKSLVESYSDPLAALCHTCHLNIKRALAEFPPPPNKCQCCHESTRLPKTDFCSNCFRWLQEDNSVDSGYGVWVRNRVTSQIICIEYSKPISGL